MSFLFQKTYILFHVFNDSLIKNKKNYGRGCTFFQKTIFKKVVFNDSLGDSLQLLKKLFLRTPWDSCLCHQPPRGESRKQKLYSS